MANKPNHTCAVCGRQYYACRSCDKRNTWKSVCDTPQHYQVYITVVQYKRGLIDKETARMYFDRISVTREEMSRFVDGVRDVIGEVFKEDGNTAEEDCEV